MAADALVEKMGSIASELLALRGDPSTKLLRVLTSNGFDVLERISSALGEDPLTAKLDHLALVHGNSSALLSKSRIVQQIVLRVWRGDHPADVISSLRQALEKEKDRTVSCLALAGLAIDEEIKLDETVRLVPTKYFPDGTELSDVFRGLASDGTLSSLFGRLPDGWADSALAIEREIDTPVVPTPATGLPKTTPAMLSRATEDRRLLGMAHAAIVLSGNHAPLVVAWFQCLLGPGFFQGHTDGRMVPLVRPLFPPPQEKVDVARLRETFALCRRFRKWEQIEISVERLKSARQARDPLAKAIDMGIALEALLMHGEQHENQEITNKLRTRAAWFIGKGPDERQSIAKLVGDAYATRSKAVHNGKLDDKQLRIMERWSDVDDVCRRLILRVLELGKFPNWNQLVLGANA